MWFLNLYLKSFTVTHNIELMKSLYIVWSHFISFSDNWYRRFLAIFHVNCYNFIFVFLFQSSSTQFYYMIIHFRLHTLWIVTILSSFFFFNPQAHNFITWLSIFDFIHFLYDFTYLILFFLYSMYISIFN